MRKEAGFEIADHIASYYEGGDYVCQVMNDYENYIKHETLSDKIQSGIPSESVHSESYKISGYEMKLAVVKNV
jgi:hypothetical protein